MSGMRGRFPGGPSRRGVDDPDAAPREKVRLSTVEEIESRAATGSEERRKRSRRKRVRVGFAFAVAAAAGVGLWIGFSSHRSAEDIAQEMSQRERQADFDLNKQADRLISEMWKTEALEKIPGSR